MSAGAGILIVFCFILTSLLAVVLFSLSNTKSKYYRLLHLTSNFIVEPDQGAKMGTTEALNNLEQYFVTVLPHTKADPLFNAEVLGTIYALRVKYRDQ